MKIAHIVPVMTTVPPKKYGGIEQVVTELALGLAAKKHEVTIFAAKGSGKFAGQRIKTLESSPFPTIQDLSQNRYWEISQWLQVISLQEKFDFLHFHYEPLISRVKIDGKEFNLLDFIYKPSLVTFHNTSHIPKNIAYYKKAKNLHQRHYVFLSKNHRQPLEFLPHSHVVHNGIPVERFVYNSKPKDYLLFIGRITPSKGLPQAIEAAKLAGKKLLIVAKIDPTDQKYYNNKIRRLIDGKQIIYAGEADFKQKVDYYRNAYGTLFPIQWDEPFGLVMVESMACGTPVIAFNRGSVPELVKNGTTGFVVDSVKKMAEAINKLDSISRQKCRDHVEENFSSEKMVEDYTRLYSKILKDKKYN